MHKSIKIVSKFVAKLLKFRILFKDILTFLGLEYRDFSLITLYLLVIGISTLIIEKLRFLKRIFSYLMGKPYTFCNSNQVQILKRFWEIRQWMIKWCSSPFMKITKHILILGEYECLAKNKLGTAISTIFLEGKNFLHYSLHEL